VVRAADSIQGPTGIQELAYDIRALHRAHYTHASAPVNEGKSTSQSR
jgi:ribosomal protein S6